MSAIALLLFGAGLVALILRFGGPAAREVGARPIALIVFGGLLILAGRVVFGVPIVLLGVGDWYASRHSRSANSSRVETGWLRMSLDHSSDAMDGEILRGTFEGRTLESLSQDELAVFAGEVAREADAQTRQLVEAYLDRRTPGWRDGPHGDEASGLGVPPGAGAMGEKEAYDVLGLAPGAGEAEIREAHRRLMKRAHPDAGGSAESAARLNEAKDVLLRAHGL